jgi:molybdate transport system ATP-binding protein
MTLADRLVLIEDGRVTQAGTPAEIRDAPRTPYAAELVGLNLFAGRLVRLDDGAGALQTADGPVVVGWPADAVEPVDTALGLLRPADVSLFADRPDGSARNLLEGTVIAVSFEGDRARIRLDTHPPVVAEVTPGSVERLGLSEGVRVWASFKAVEVRVIVD